MWVTPLIAEMRAPVLLLVLGTDHRGSFAVACPQSDGVPVLFSGEGEHNVERFVGDLSVTNLDVVRSDRSAVPFFRPLGLRSPRSAAHGTGYTTRGSPAPH